MFGTAMVIDFASITVCNIIDVGLSPEIILIGMTQVGSALPSLETGSEENLS